LWFLRAVDPEESLSYKPCLNLHRGQVHASPHNLWNHRQLSVPGEALLNRGEPLVFGTGMQQLVLPSPSCSWSAGVMLTHIQDKSSSTPKPWDGKEHAQHTQQPQRPQTRHGDVIQQGKSNLRVKKCSEFHALRYRWRPDVDKEALWDLLDAAALLHSFVKQPHVLPRFSFTAESC